MLSPLLKDTPATSMPLNATIVRPYGSPGASVKAKLLPASPAIWPQ